MRDSLNAAVFDAAIDSWRARSKKHLYQRDPIAWLSDVVGERTYGKMAEITEAALLSTDVTQTLIKSANGSGKTFTAARWVAWWVTAFDPRDSLVIVTGPRLQQVEFGVFSNLKRLLGEHEARAITGRAAPGGEFDPAFAAWPGRINEQNEWIMATRSGNEALALAAVPSQHEAATRLVGLRKPGGRNLIVADEAGGLTEQVWDAAMALQTAGGSRGIFIGNPTNRGDGFYQRFDDLAKFGSEYNRFTISAYDTPALTGEVVYPDDPEQDKLLKTKGLTSRAWVASMERMFVSVPPGSTARYTEEDPLTGDTLRRVDPFHADAKLDGTFRVRVLGEFADEADTAFFSQNAIDTAYATTLGVVSGDVDESIPVILGCDISRFGSDESVIYENRGGRVRFVSSWSKSDAVQTAERIHNTALRLGAAQVRVDVTGVGGPVADIIADYLPSYLLIGIDNSTKAPDPRRFLNMRAYNHAQVRDFMFGGKLDLDPEDRELWKQIVALTYKFTPRNALQITSKDEMRSSMGGSPDRLDAMIYAAVDLSWLTTPGARGPQIGDIVLQDPRDLIGDWTLDPSYPL